MICGPVDGAIILLTLDRQTDRLYLNSTLLHGSCFVKRNNFQGQAVRTCTSEEYSSAEIDTQPYHKLSDCLPVVKNDIY